MTTASSNYINIGGDPDDTFYRYKREISQVKYESKNGIQTKWINMDAIFKQLKYSTDQLHSYLKKGLNMNVKDNIIHGNVTVAQIEKILQKFVTEIILCPTCKLPEWNLQICRACGHSTGKSLTNKKFTTKFNPLNTVQEEQLEELTIDDEKLNRHIAKRMHLLYDLRTCVMNTNTMNQSEFTPLLRRIERFINLCWECNDEKRWNKLKGEIDEFLNQNSCNVNKSNTSSSSTFEAIS